MTEEKKVLFYLLTLPQPDEFVNGFYDRSDSDLRELVDSYDEKEQKQLWDALSSQVITATIQEAAMTDDTGEDNPNAADPNSKMSIRLLKLAVKFAKATVSQDCSVPQSLYDTVLLLHGYVMAVSHGELQSSVASLCQAWWLNGIEGRESLTTVPLIYLLEKCLAKKPPVQLVKRLWGIREAVSTVEEAGGQMVWDLVLNLFAHVPFLRNTKGQKFLSYVLATQQHLLKKIYGVMKHNLAHSTGVIAEIYGQLTLNAWERCGDSSFKSMIESDVIQDLMYNCIHIHRNGNKSLHSHLMKFMFKLHSRRSNASICKMLVDLYKPILWRAMRAANADVRANATQLFFDCFPLVNTQLSWQHCETSLQQQFDLIFSLLEDEDHVVRQVSVTGICQVLYSFRDKIPDEVTSDLLTILFSKLVWDQSSVDVRVAAIQGISKLLDNHTHYAVLANLMPTLSDLLHDKSDKVRMVFVRLLLKMKHIRAFKIWKIVSKEHVFARLEIENTPICLKLVELTYKSFINDDLDKTVQLERCIELIESGVERARRFYRYAVVLMNVQQAVNYMLLLRKCIMACVSQHKKGKENRRPSLCTTLANLTMAANQTTTADRTTSVDKTMGIEGNFTMIDNHLTVYSLPSKDVEESQNEEILSVDNTLVMRALLDIICIIWAGFRKELDMAGNAEIKQILCDKFSRALVEFFPTFVNEDIQHSLLYLASFLPSEYTAALRKDVEKRLRELPSVMGGDASTTPATVQRSNLVLCLSRWGLTNKVLDLLVKWSAPLSSTNRSRRSSRDGGSSDCSLRCLIQVANDLFNLPHYTQLIADPDYTEQFETLCQRLNNVQKMCANNFGGNDSMNWDMDLMMSLLTVHSKLLFTVYQNKAEKLTSSMTHLCSIVSNSCVNHLNTIEGREPLTPHCEVKKPRRLLDLQETVLQQSVQSNNSTLVSSSNSYNTELATKFTLTVLSAAANYINISTISSISLLKPVTSLFKHADTLCASDSQLSNSLLEVLLQVTKASLISSTLFAESETELTLQEIWSSFLRARISNMNTLPLLAGKSKSMWVSTLQCMELLYSTLQQVLVDVIVTSLLSLLAYVDMTPSLASNVEVTVKSSRLVQQYIITRLKEGTRNITEADASREDNSDAVQFLVKLAEKQ